MGGFVDFECKFCHYAERGIAVGHGKAPSPFLALYRCDHCKTVGSTWFHEDKIPRCAGCYHDVITILPQDARRVTCPKCGEPALLTPREGSWE